MNHSPTLDRLRARFEALGPQTLAMPEWPDEHDAPTLVHWTPLTMADRNAVAAKSGGRGLEAAVELVLLKAQDAEGKPLFLPQDRPHLLNFAEAAPIERLANAIMGGDPGN